MHLSTSVETRELTGNKNHNDIQKKMKLGERERKMHMKRGVKALRERERARKGGLHKIGIIMIFSLE